MASPENFTAGSGTRSIAYAVDTFFSAAAVVLICSVAEAVNLLVHAPAVLATVVLTYQAYFLAFQGGSTPGKLIRNVCVISADGQPLHVAQAVLRAAFTSLPYVCLATGPLEINVLVYGLEGLLPTLGVALLFADLLLLEYTPARRTLTDRLSRTLVVNLPPVQPHRAPAGPMFSRGDAEFGNPPRRPPRTDRDSPEVRLEGSFTGMPRGPELRRRRIASRNSHRNPP